MGETSIPYAKGLPTAGTAVLATRRGMGGVDLTPTGLGPW